MPDIRNRCRLFPALLRHLLLAIVALAAVPAAPQTICPATMVSRAVNGNSASGFEPSASYDGRFATFRSGSTNVVAPPIDVRLSHLYRRDLLTGTTEPLHSAQPGAGWSDQPAGGRLTGDGRSVVFDSAAGNITPGDVNGRSDVFIRTFGSGALEMLSLPDRDVVLQKKVTHTLRGGYEASPDYTGDNVAFLSASTVLTLDYYRDADQSTTMHVYVRNRALGRTFRVTKTAVFGQPINGAVRKPLMTANGQVLVFATFARNLKGFERPVEKWDLYVATFNGAEWAIEQRIDTGVPGYQGGDQDYAISPDGRYVAWVAKTSAGDELMLFDRHRGTTRRVRPSHVPTQAGQRVYQPVLAVNGLAWRDHRDYTGEGVGGAYYLDLGPGGRIHRVGRDLNGLALRQGTAGFSNPPDEIAISGDGRFVLYRSASAFIEEPDGNQFWDIFVQDMRPCLDMDLAAIDAGPFLDPQWTDVLDEPVEAAARLAALPPSRVMRGIAADGAARLIVRAIVHEAGTVSFTPRFRNDVAHPQCASPQIRALNGLPANSADVPTVPLAAGRHVAFAVLPAPEELVRRGMQCPEAADRAAESLDIELEAVFTRADGTTAVRHTPLRVQRPPVVLVHGLWSAPDTWKWELPRVFRVTRADYETTNAHHYVLNVPRVARQISNAIHDLDREGIAASRADVIAHSMGAVLTRHWAAGTFDSEPMVRRPEPYRQPANFMLGAIRRFVLLNSPQFGADVANVIVAQMQTHPNGRDFFRGLGMCIDCGAVEDLQIPPASPFSRWQPTALQAHAITGNGGDHGLEGGLAVLALALKSIGVDYDDVYGGCVDDGVVPLYSQQAGLFEPHRMAFTGSDSLHTRATRESAQRDHAFALLDGPADAFTTMPDGPRTPSLCNVSFTPSAPVIPGGGIRLRIVPSLAGAYAPGATLRIEILPTRSFVPAEAWITTSLGETREASGTPLTVMYTIPASASGRIRVVGIASDATNALVNSAAAYIRVTSPALLSLRFDADSEELRLSSAEPQQRTGITGAFHDGLERDVEGGDLTTNGIATPVVFTSSNTAVATVTPAGLVIAHEPGQAAVSARVGTAMAVRSVSVEAAASPQCSDGIDNDGDGLADFAGGDPGCRSATDLTEAGGTGDCDDGIDNDLDGTIDFGPDSGCTAFPDVETGPPAADLYYECQGTTCSFFGEVSTGERALVSWLWNFGDGSPAVQGANPTHTFAAAGPQTITLTVTDDAGASDTRSWTVSIP